MLTTLAGVRDEIKNNIKFNPFINWFKNDIGMNVIMKLKTQIFVHAGIDEEAESGKN